MTSENAYAIPDGRRPQAPPHRQPPDRSVLALLRVGTRGCRLAAALIAVVVGLASQVGSVAVAQAKQTRLYLDAPAVSPERASRAGEVANAYAKPGSPASWEVLAWLEVPVRPVDVSPPPGGATKAFASITARDGEGAGGVTPDDALAARETMLAQLEGPPLEKDDESGGEELASSEAVRPQLGDGEQASKAPETDGAEEQRPGDTDLPTYEGGSSAYASTQGAAVPVGEPSGGPGMATPTPSTAAEETTDEVPEQAPPTEFASAPSDTGSTTAVPDPGTGEETYGPSGPISDAGQAPTILTPVGPEDASSEDAGDGDEQQPYPDESAPVDEPEPVSDAPEEEPAGTEPMGEDTGPTSDGEDEIALVPVPPSVDEEPPAAEDDFEQAEYQVPVAPPNAGGGSEIAQAEHPTSTEAMNAYAEPPPPAEEVLGNPAESDVPEAASTEILAAEADEERAEVVIGGDEVPAAVPSEDEAPPEHTPPAEGFPGRKGDGEDASLYGDTRWGAEQGRIPAEEPSGEDTRWGPQVAEDPPADQEPVGDAPLVEEPTDDTSLGGRPVEESPEHEPPRVALPDAVSPLEEPSFTDEGVVPEPAPGALPQGDATEIPPEGQQPGSDYRSKDPQYATGAPPGSPGAAQASQGTGQEEEQRGWDLRQDGPRRDQDRLPETDPAGPVDEQIGRNDGAGGAVPGDAQNLISQTAENASVIQQEQAVVIEKGGSSDGTGAPEPPPVPDAPTRVPEPLPQAAPQTIKEPVVAEPVPQAVPTPMQATAEEPVAWQYDEPAPPASTQQYDPASQPVTAAPTPRTGDPTASDPDAAERALGQGAASREPLAGPETETKTDQRGGRENR